MATLKTFKTAYDVFISDLVELMGINPEQRGRYSALMGYEYEGGLLLASNMRCLMFMKYADKISIMDTMDKYGISNMATPIFYKLAIKYPFGGKADHRLNVDSLRDAIDKSKKCSDPIVCLPDGLCYNPHYLNTALKFFSDEDVIEARTVPFPDPNTGADKRLLLLRNLERNAFFFICPNLEADPGDGIRYVEKISKEELSGTLFDLL